MDLIFPSHCLNCRKSTNKGRIICGECLSSVPLNKTLFCGKCRLRLAANKKVCHKDFPYVLGAATDYCGAAKELVQAAKFKFVKSAADDLAGLLIKYALQAGFKSAKFIAVPVPLSDKRLRERGFNQSELIAKNFADFFRTPLITDALARTKHAKPQSESKNADERRENVRGAFTVKKPKLVSGKNVILLDDVITSGATMLEAAKTLKAAGARRIIALTVAKA